MPNFIDDTPAGECLFCKIARGLIPAAKVYEDDLVLAFMDIGPVNEGHVLVATRRHAVTLYDLTDEEAAAVLRASRRIGLAIRAAFDPPGLMLFQANGPEAGQTVFHFHMHLVPRWADDGAGFTWPRHPQSPEALRAVAGRVAAALNEVD